MNCYRLLQGHAPVTLTPLEGLAISNCPWYCSLKSGSNRKNSGVQTACRQEDLEEVLKASPEFENLPPRFKPLQRLGK